MKHRRRSFILWKGKKRESELFVGLLWKDPCQFVINKPHPNPSPSGEGHALWNLFKIKIRILIICCFTTKKSVLIPVISGKESFSIRVNSCNSWQKKPHPNPVCFCQSGRLLLPEKGTFYEISLKLKSESWLFVALLQKNQC